jgi:error-prone DNA polymerase
LQRADTVGLFQVESRAQMSCLPRLKPKCFYDIVVQVAIIRPGPIVGKMVHPYLNRRMGREPAESLHPSLESTLSRTLGVPLFQEQLLRIAMIAAGFSGGEAEELRRAFGFKRSEARMKEIEVKLRRGMESKGITGETQDKVVQAITSFALYGFPESHAASFALIAYASAFLKCHYLAAFTAAMLNNQPMGFYQPATLIKDAQRHGQKFKPIDITTSRWECTICLSEDAPTSSFLGADFTSIPSRAHDGAESLARKQFPVRIGLRYVKGLRKETAMEILAQRSVQPFASIEDLKQRVPQIQKDELRVLAAVGALNFISGKSPIVTGTLRPSPATEGLNVAPRPAPVPIRSGARQIHRRTALWQVERAGRPAGELFEASVREGNSDPAFLFSPLEMMNDEERLLTDFQGTGLTVGRHPMAAHRERLSRDKVSAASHLASLKDGTFVRVAGAVIVRQRPGTAKGFVFLSLEDETGIANIIITPQLFEQDHIVVVHNSFLLIDGILQNQDGVISVKAGKIQPFHLTRAAAPAHDFY